MKPDINKMTLREKIAQIMLVRQCDLLLRADKAYDELRDTSEAKEIMDKNQFGGIWAHGNLDVNQMSVKYNDYFNFDTKKYVKWLNSIIADLKIRPICANDISNRACFSDLSNFIDGLIIGAANSTEYAFELGKCIGEQHRAMGGNWVWTPDIDILNRLGGEIVRCKHNFHYAPEWLYWQSHKLIS